jgi:excisionase family DNA binding protein
MSDRILLTVRDVAVLTGFSEGTLRHWVSQKRIPVVRFSSRCVRFRLIDIQHWIAEKVVERETKMTLRGPAGRQDRGGTLRPKEAHTESAIRPSH